MFADLSALSTEFRTRARDLSLHVQVAGHGNINARYAIVVEGPGQADVNEGRYFAGLSGALLWNALRPHKILQTDFYITSVCKRQISLSKKTQHPVSAEEWMRWETLLDWELEQLPNLEAILVLGAAGLQAIVGKEGIKKFRGSVYQHQVKDRTVPVMISLNPAAIAREPRDEIVFRLDMVRFSKVISGQFKEHSVTTHINPTFTEAVEFLDHLIHTDIMPSYDIEVIAGQTACHGFAISPYEAMCINLRNEFENRYSLEDELKLLYKLQDLFDAKPVIAQNGNFDSTWVGHHDLLRVRIGFDTLLAHHTLYPTLPHDLGFLTSQYTTHPYYKDEIDLYKEGGDIDTFWTYNGKDCAITFACAQALRQELQVHKLEDFYYNHVMRLEPHLVRTTIEGLAVDQTIKEKVALELADSTAAVENEFISQARQMLKYGDHWTMNIRSPKQMQDLMFDRLKVKSVDRAFDATARTKILEDSRTPMDVAKLVLTYNDYQKQHKFLSTYAESKIDPDGRIRYVFKQNGVVQAPGRLSSSGTLWGCGLNMQNQPKAAYKFYTADTDCVMFYFDLSQAEARVVAYLADIEKWKEDFELARTTGTFDAHRSLASSMYKVPYDQVPTEDVDADGNFTIRYKGKRCRHGLNYTMQWPRLAETTGMSPYDAKRSYILYHQTNPEIQKWWRQIELVAKKDRRLVTPMGRVLPILERIDGGNLGNLVAFVPQSTIGDKVKQVWYQCHEDPEWDMRYMRIKLNIHDALIGIATPDKVHTALKIAKRYAEAPIKITNIYKTKTEELIIPADTAISEPDEYGIHRWSTLKKVKL